MQQILVIEDSGFFAKAVEKSLIAKLGVPVSRADSLSEAQSVIKRNPDGFSLAIVDLNLPDAKGNEAVRLTSAHGIPSIVFSGKLDPGRRDELYKLGVIDSVPKDSPSCLDYATNLAGRILRNAATAAMVVEDSDVARNLIHRLLERQGLQVLTAHNGQEALSLLKIRPDVRLMLVDYEMPNMSGFELTREVRRSHPSDKLGIIGMSATSEPELVVRFLKSGANDFIHKPFSYEELLCRTTQNLDMLDHIERFEHMATRDFLTGLHNRRHLFEVGTTLHANAAGDNLDITVGVLDIDFFKKVNDSYGHDAGDLVLKVAAETLLKQFREADIVARLGGEEFCVVAINLDPAKATDVFERARIALRETRIDLGDRQITVTASMGVCSTLHESFEAMVGKADEALYQAKESGRDRVVIHAS